MLPSRSSNEGSFVDLVGSLSNSLNTSTTSSSKNNRFVELDENDFQTHLSNESQGCFQSGDRALGSSRIGSSQPYSNRSGSDRTAVQFDRTEPNVFVNQSGSNQPPGASSDEQFKLIDLRDDQDGKLSAEISFDPFDCFSKSERPHRADNQRHPQANNPSAQPTEKGRNLVLPGRTLDYCPAGQSHSSGSSSSNLTDENSNECDSFLKRADSQAKYFNRTKKMSYKIKGVKSPESKKKS